MLIPACCRTGAVRSVVKRSRGSSVSAGIVVPSTPVKPAERRNSKLGLQTWKTGLIVRVSCPQLLQFLAGLRELTLSLQA